MTRWLPESVMENYAGYRWLVGRALLSKPDCATSCSRTRPRGPDGGLEMSGEASDISKARSDRRHPLGTPSDACPMHAGSIPVRELSIVLDFVLRIEYQ